MSLTRENLQIYLKNKNEIQKQFPTLILDLVKPKLYKSCQTCGSRGDPNKTNFITCVNVIICKYCCTPYGYI